MRPGAEHSQVAVSSVLSSLRWFSTAGSGSPVCSADWKLPPQHWTPPDHFRPCWLSRPSPREPTHHFGEPKDANTVKQPKRSVQMKYSITAEKNRTGRPLPACSVFIIKSNSKCWCTVVLRDVWQVRSRWLWGLLQPSSALWAAPLCGSSRPAAHPMHAGTGRVPEGHAPVCAGLMTD